MQRDQADVYIFGDEAGIPDDFGNLAINRYFMVVTATLVDCSWLPRLDGLGQALRGKLGIPQIGRPFHAAKDNPQVKRDVLQLISGQELRIDATVIDKQTLRPELRRRHRLYAAMRAYGAASSSVLGLGQLGVMRLGALPVLVIGNHSSPSTELGLQVADYCAWPIQRKWERRDLSAYNLVKNRVRSERLVTL